MYDRREKSLLGIYIAVPLKSSYIIGVGVADVTVADKTFNRGLTSSGSW